MFSKKLATNKGIEKYVKFYGYKTNASRCMQLFDCLVLCSISEGLPLTILEGFREKVPVIASDIPEIKEIVEDKITGFLFHSNKLDSLVKVLNSVLSSSKEELSKITSTAYRYYEKEFKVEVMVKKYMELYEFALKNKKSKYKVEL